MKLQVFCLWDSKIESFMSPFFLKTVAEAKRAISDLCKEQGKLAVHVEDYSLFHLGSWNDSSAIFDLKAAPEVVCPCVELLSKQSSE